MKTSIILILLTCVLANGQHRTARAFSDFNGTTSEAQSSSNATAFAPQVKTISPTTPHINDQKISSSTQRSKQVSYQKTQTSTPFQQKSNQPHHQPSKETTKKYESTTEEVTDDPYAPEIYVQPKDKEDIFDWKLSQEIFKEQIRTKNNVIISPVSIKLLLTILAEAAGQDVDSPTRTELMKALPFNQTLEDTRLYFKKVLESLKVQSKYYTVNVGTSGFVREGVALRQKFTAKIAYNYDVQMQPSNFNDPEGAAKKINDWVKNITNGKISDLVNAEGVESCVMLLINAIYFKGIWKIPFEKIISSEFYSTPMNSQKKDFVQQTGDYFYHYNPELKVRFLRLPYEGKRFSMFVILPFEKDGLADVMEKFDATLIRDVVNNMRLMQVQVTLPKFKFESSMNLNKVVQNLGITEIFKDSATLPNLISHGRGMKVSNIIQKAGIVVDEKGSEAFAATEIDLVDKFGGDPREFLADHPFLFYIEDDTTGAKLFAGVINNPEFSI